MNIRNQTIVRHNSYGGELSAFELGNLKLLLRHGDDRCDVGIGA